jgi:hypothetical protein
MHTHDRTLIASLGFNDPDKKNVLHDLACAYLTQTEVIRSIIPPPKTTRFKVARPPAKLTEI